MLHAVLVRSPVAHVRIRTVDLARTSAAPGVVLALNGIDLLQLLLPEGQISMPSKGTSVIQHKFLNPQSRYWRMTRCEMSARRLQSLSRRAATRPKRPNG